MVDATLEILARTAKGKTDNPVMYLMTEPVFNIDDMDGKATMGNLKLSGCYVISSSKAIDPRFPGKIFVDGLEAGTPLIPEISMFGQTIGIFLRKLLNEYDRQYTIRFEGARDMDGNTMAPFEFSIRTLPKVQPGGVYPEHDLLVLQAARESAVLLKNDKNTLPLANGSVINAFGKAGPAYRLGMCGAAKINPRYGIRFEEGIKAYSSLVLNQELFD